MLASEYGWTIEYISNLSMRQIRCLFDGKLKIAKAQNKQTENIGKDDMSSNSNTTGARKVKLNKQTQLFSMPGVSLTPAAKKKLEEMKKNFKG